VRGEFTAGKRVGYLADGTRVVARAAICATGVEYHRLPVANEERFRGLFAAGDVRHGSVKRCASAVGEGAMAVMFVHRYLADG
jgi:thioredoxin reductase (NADPH)